MVGEANLERFIECRVDLDDPRTGNAAINVMQKDKEKGSLRGKIIRTGWDDAYLARLLTLF